MATQPVGQLEKVRALASSSRLCFVAGVRADTASQVTAYDHVTEKPVYVINAPAHVLCLAATDEILVTGAADGSVCAWKVKDGSSAWGMKAHPGPCTAVAIRGKAVATVGADGALRLFALADGKLKKEWALFQRPLRAVAIDPSGELFAAGGDDAVITVVGEGHPRRDMPGHDGPVLSRVHSCRRATGLGRRGWHRSRVVPGWRRRERHPRQG